MKKRVGLFTLAVLSGMAVASPSAMAAGGFSDVGEKMWFAQAVRNFSATGLISGYEDGTFRPDNTVNRSEFVQMLYNVMGKQAVDAGAKVPFSDVEGKWYSAAVTFASESRLLDEFPAKGTFHADQKLTRGEAARLIWNMIGQDEERNMQPDATRFPQHLKANTAGGKSFVDTASFPAWAKLPIEQLAHFGVINGYSDGTFQPGKAITRAEATALLDGALRKVGYAAILNATVTEKKFIDAMYEVLGKASTMANVEWVDFNAFPIKMRPTHYDSSSSPDGGGYTADKVGLIPENPNGQVNAGVAAQWLAKWAKPARAVNLDSLSLDAYSWAKLNGWFDGTSVTEATDIIQPSDVTIMNRNLQTWLVGYRLEGHTAYLHYPMIPVEPIYGAIEHRPPGERQYFPDRASMKQTILNSIQRYNRTKVTVENGVATYYEDPATTERVFFEFGEREGGRHFTASYDGFYETFPLRFEMSPHETVLELELGPTHQLLVRHGGYGNYTYGLYLDSARNLSRVELGKYFDLKTGLIDRAGGNIITNYPKMATTF